MSDGKIVNHVVIAAIVGVFTMIAAAAIVWVFTTISWYFFSPPQPDSKNSILQECEAKLPRGQKCELVITAIPIE